MADRAKSQSQDKIDLMLGQQVSRRHAVTLSLGAACAATLGFSKDAYAAKKAVTKYDIVYVLNGGTQAKGQRAQLKADATYSATKLLKPKRRGYSFTGWFADEELVKPLEVLQGVKKASKRTAYAGWKKKTYTFTYVDNDPFDTVRTKDYTVTTATFKHEEPSRKGWAFAGWFEDAKLKTQVSNTVQKGSIGSKTLYAKWDMKAIWKTYLEEMIPKVQAKKDLASACGESFVFLTDPHIKSNAMCSAPAVKKVMEDADIELFFMGGDFLNAHATKEDALDRFKLWSKEMSFATVYCVRGNHDNNNNNATTYPNTAVHVSDDELCQLVFPQLLGADGKTCKETIPQESTSVPGLLPADGYQQPAAAMEVIGETSTIRTINAAREESLPAQGVELAFEKRELCYVVDNNEAQVRHIILDSGAPDASVVSDKQLLWMQRRILELEDDWTVLVFVHQFFCVNRFDMSGQQIMRALDAVYDSSAAVIAGVISGHSHRDLAYRSPKGYVAICSACDAYKAVSNADIAVQRKTGVVRQAFDVVHLNTSKRELYFQRIGFGSDRVFSY